MNRSHRGGHDHPDDDALTIGCSACIARVEHDQAEAAWAVAPLRRCTWTFDASLDASMSFALDVRVPAGVEPWEVDERYCDLTGEQISDALAAAKIPREHTASEPTRGRSADAARRIALDDHRRQRAELQATIAAEGIQL